MGGCCGSNSIEGESSQIAQRDTGRRCHDCCRSYKECILKTMPKPRNYTSSAPQLQPAEYYNQKYPQAKIDVYEARKIAKNVKEINFKQALAELKKEHRDFFAIKITGFNMNDGQVEDILNLCKTQRMICFLVFTLHYSCFEQERIWRLILEVLSTQYCCKVVQLKFLMDNEPQNDALHQIINEVMEDEKYQSLEERRFDFEALNKKKQSLLKQQSGYRIELANMSYE